MGRWVVLSRFNQLHWLLYFYVVPAYPSFSPFVLIWVWVFLDCKLLNPLNSKRTPSWSLVNLKDLSGTTLISEASLNIFVALELHLHMCFKMCVFSPVAVWRSKQIGKTDFLIMGLSQWTLTYIKHKTQSCNVQKTPVKFWGSLTPQEVCGTWGLEVLRRLKPQCLLLCVISVLAWVQLLICITVWWIGP